MRLLRQLFKPRRRRVMPPLVSGRVVMGDDDTYGVRLRRFGEHVDRGEYLRFFLHYYAEVLFYCGRGPQASPRTAETLQAVMRRAATALATGSTDPLAWTSLHALTITEPALVKASRQIRATLFRDRASGRQLAAEFVGGVQPTQAATSVLALLRECLGHLRDDERAPLGRALLHMDRMYGTGYSYAELENVSLVPNEAMLLP